MSESTSETTDTIDTPTESVKVGNIVASSLFAAMHTDQTVAIVEAFVGRNDVTIEQLPLLISTVYNSLSGLGQTETVTETVVPTPAVPVGESVQNEYLVCLEDGKKLKMLKRHLQSAYNMTPEQYRAKWGLDPNYPMTAPAYAEVRSGLAKKIGLGTNGGGRKTVAKAKAKAPTRKAAAKRKAA